MLAEHILFYFQSISNRFRTHSGPFHHYSKFIINLFPGPDMACVVKCQPPSKCWYKLVTKKVVGLGLLDLHKFYVKRKDLHEFWGKRKKARCIDLPFGFFPINNIISSALYMSKTRLPIVMHDPGIFWISEVCIGHPSCVPFQSFGAKLRKGTTQGWSVHTYKKWSMRTWCGLVSRPANFKFTFVSLPKAHVRTDKGSI